MHQLPLTVFALAALLGLVSLLLPVAERMRVPHAVLLAAAGCLIGGAIAGFGSGTGLIVADDVLQALGRMNLSSETFLFIFLPALLFETALNVDVRRLAEDVGPVLLLAVIGVLVSTFVVGFALAPFAPVSLLACLLLGAILATTDPVAVVAVFRDIGAPRRLSLLAEGERLLNDAAAIALFGLIVAMMIGTSAVSPLDAAMHFVLDFAGGLAFGWVTGRLACLFLPSLREH